MTGWKTDFNDSDSDFSESDLPPTGYNADAALARELDLSRVWEPAALKATQTPFTLANRRKKDAEEKRAQKAARDKAEADAAEKDKEARERAAASRHSAGAQQVGSKMDARPAKQGKQGLADIKGKGKATEPELSSDSGTDLDDTDTESDSGQSSSSSSPSHTPPPLAPKPVRRRGPVPAKSGRLFSTEVPDEDKPKAGAGGGKQPYRRWTKAERDGWRDVSGKPIPSTNTRNGGPVQLTLKDVLDQPVAKGRAKGKGASGAKGKEKVVHVPAPGAGIVLPHPAVEMVTKGRKKVPTVKAAETGAENAEAGPRRKRGRQDDGGSEVDAKKSKTVGATKGKAKGKAKADSEKIVFTRPPAGAAPNADFPILEGIERQRSLPTKPKPKPKTQPKSKGKGKAAAQSSPSPSAADAEAEALLTELLAPPGTDKRPITIDRLLPPSTLAVKRKPASDAGGDSIDSFDGDGVEEDAGGQQRVRLGLRGEENEDEGKKAVMSRYFGTTSKDGTARRSGKASEPATLVDTPAGSPVDDPPTITKLDAAQYASPKPLDSSSNLPYSSPTERHQLRHQDSNLVHPQPVRARVDPLPNADKYDQQQKLKEQQQKAHFARLQEAADQAGKEAARREKNKDVPDVASFQRKGYTHVAAPMSTSKGRRPRSPQSQIDARFRSHTLKPLRPDLNQDFRPPAYIRAQADLPHLPDLANADEWSTIGTKGKKRNPYDSDYIANLISGPGSASRPSGRGEGMTTSQMQRTAKLFTPQAPPPPAITTATPKFRLRTNVTAAAGTTQQYGAAAPSKDTADVYDVYKRKTGGDLPRRGTRPLYGDVRASDSASASTPEEETLVGRYGLYKVQKTPLEGRGETYGERPRYFPGTMMTLDQDAGMGGTETQDWDPATMDAWRRPTVMMARPSTNRDEEQGSHDQGGHEGAYDPYNFDSAIMDQPSPRLHHHPRQEHRETARSSHETQHRNADTEDTAPHVPTLSQRPPPRFKPVPLDVFSRGAGRGYSETGSSTQTYTQIPVGSNTRDDPDETGRLERRSTKTALAYHAGYGHQTGQAGSSGW